LFLGVVWREEWAEERRKGRRGDEEMSLRFSFALQFE
jgi:hypothetical protein